MKLALFIAFALFAALVAAHGRGRWDDGDSDDYVVRRVTVASFSTAIYYPACKADDKDADECENGRGLPSRKTFSAVILHQGGSVDASYYSQVAIKIAKEGYIVAVPNAPRQIVFGTPVQLTNTNITLATKVLLQQLNGDASSPIFGRLTANSFALVGHSFGGVVSLINGAVNGPALCANPANGLAPVCPGFQGFGAGLKAVIVYGSSFTTRRGPSVTVIGVTASLVPTIFIRGAQDGVVLRDDVINGYNQLANTTKAFIELEGANHFGITDLQIVPNATVDNAVQLTTNDYSTNKIAKIVVTGLKAHVDGSNQARRLIYQRKDLKILQTNVTFSQP